jgi:alkaline phosphatase D
MNRERLLVCLSALTLLLTLSACKTGSGQDTRTATAPQHHRQAPDSVRVGRHALTRIAFGSCAHQEKDQPILDSVVARHPDLFIYLGDNIYGDTRDMQKLRRKYEVLGAKPEFQRLWQRTQVLATWDDHDYGENDAGRYYPFRKESKELFLDFWKEPQLSPRRLHPGIYHAEEFGPPEKRVQVILLDTRTFRDDLVRAGGIGAVPHYVPNPSPDSTFLGAQQWRWLEDQLRKPAQVRVIASSNQFSQAHSGYESWTNVPHERARLLSLLRRTQAEAVVFISGDVHYGELSVERSDSLYPIYDLTSSGITQSWSKVAPNANRIGEPVIDNNFGMIEIDWEARSLQLVLTDLYGKERLRETVRLQDLR